MPEEIILLFTLGLPLVIAVYALHVPMYPERKQKRQKRGFNWSHKLHRPVFFLTQKSAILHGKKTSTGA